MARTQKARGFKLLKHHMLFPYGGVEWRQTPGASIFPEHISSKLTLPAFARPCPMRPRHGFVESREVHTVADVLKVIAETQAQDPLGEVIVMPRLSGKWSGIINHSGVTLGLRNDGATSGDASRFIPAYVDNATFIEKMDAENDYAWQAGIKEAPYVEFVEDEHLPVVVQLRDGPVIPRGTNYVPHEVRVSRVIRAGGDLLQWETDIANVAKQDGVVVWHPQGSLSSHYAVHAMLNHVPVIIDHEPQLGEVIPAADWQPPSLTKGNLQTIANMIQARFDNGYGYENEPYHKRMQEIALAAVGTLHASPQWGREHHLLKLRAEGVVAMLRFTGAACLGELRHWFGLRGPNRGDFASEVLKHAPFVQNEGDEDRERRLRPERHTVYELAFHLPLRVLEQYMLQAAEDFNAPGWQGGYGGRKWGDAAQQNADAIKAVRAFLDNPTPGHWKLVMGAYNRVVNAVHNGGKILNKWLSETAMDTIAEMPSTAFVSEAVAAMVLDGLVDERQGHDKVNIKVAKPPSMSPLSEAFLALIKNDMDNAALKNLKEGPGF